MSLAVIGWNLWIYAHLLPVTDENELYYVSYFGYRSQALAAGDLPWMIVQNARALILSVAQLLDLDGSASALGSVIHLMIASAVILGLFRMAKKFKLGHYHAFAVCYVAILLLWHFRPTVRLLLPVSPLLFAGCFLLIQALVEYIAALIKRDSMVSGGAAVVLSTSAALLLGLILMRYCSALSTILPDLTTRRAQVLLRLPSYDFAEKHVPASSGFIAHEDPMFYLYTGRHARSLHSPPNLLDRSGFQAIAKRYYSLAKFGREHDLDYLFFTPDDFYREARPEDLRSIVRSVVQTGRDFELLREDNGGAIYKINKTAGASPSRGAITKPQR